MAKATPTKKTSPAKPQSTPVNDEDTKAKIESLLKLLNTETVSSKKKAIRRSLRALGHTGGLRAQAS